MARVSMVYEENDCKGVIEDNEPYLILNLEKFCQLSGNRGLPHCDFVYIRCQDRRRFEIFLIELKNIKSNGNNIIDIIRKFLNNKIPQTKQLVENYLLNKLYINNPNYYGILVLPEDKFWEHHATIARTLLSLVPEFKSKNAWISACDNNVQLFSTNNIIRRKIFPSE